MIFAARKWDMSRGCGAARRIGKVLAFVVATVGSAAIAEPAVNQFETKDLEVDAGNLQFQSQNAFSAGQPRRKISESVAGERAFDSNAVVRERLAQELEVHLTDFFRMRVGLEFEKQRLDDPGTLERANAYDSLKLSELAIEGVLVLVPPKDRGLGIGLIAEYQHAMSAQEADTLFMGTILQSVAGPWSATTNLFMVRHFAPVQMQADGQTFRDNKWDFAYAAQVRYKYSETWSFAVEGYGTVDRVIGSGHQSEDALLFGGYDQHRVGPIVYYSFKTGAGRLKDRFGAGKSAATLDGGRKAGGDDDDAPGQGKGGKRLGGQGDDEEPMAIIGFGILAGVTPNTPAVTYKLSLEWEF